MPGAEGGLGTALVGEKIAIGRIVVNVSKLIGEGGFSYVYLVKDVGEGNLSGSAHGNEEPPARRNSGSGANNLPPGPMVLKVTSIHSRSQRDIAEKEAKLLSRLSHPSIIKMYDTCYRTVAHQTTGKRGKDAPNAGKERPQHLILMEYCEGGHSLDVCSQLAANNQRFDLSTLIIAFGQICNAVSYLHAQRPPIVHRDLKPVNFLVKNGAYKLCDFGSAVFGHVDLRTSKARSDAEEVIQKTTTQMFRAPEMVDLYMAKKLTQATDVWALGCCLYSLAFLQNCFEEGSNLAILSRKYTIPEDNPYGDGLVELLDRMLTVDCKARADMTEVILCLSAVYSGRPLPPRKKPSRSSKSDEKEDTDKKDDAKKESSTTERVGTYRTDAQGYQENLYDPTKATEGKKLASNSVAARRKRAAASTAPSGAAAAGSAAAPAPSSAAPAPALAPAPAPATSSADPLAFSNLQGSEDDGAADVAFSSDFAADIQGFDSKGEGFFSAFDNTKGEQPSAGGDGFDATAFDASAWGPESTDQGKDSNSKPSTDAQETEQVDNGETTKNDVPDAQRKDSRRRRESTGRRSRVNRGSVEGAVEAMNINDTENGAGEGERRERRSRAPKSEEERRQRARSSSRSKRKARQRDSRTEKPEEGASSSNGGDVEKKPPRKGGSMRNPFGRKQAPA
eukprot:CAMPEP_0113451902 /NCGR_PEP_ID=MMETSP0014_2-20120614/6573_1 /TAXON_ID=2857 /ORGANISM="Nitzschia sp." /LENGTH=676 /DNA_ID=CAMNT_0000343263 /DNA_START=516 /DNA_END=2546 /DNA_ORIENTATION=- /assembly_acc=CAM_ASM_000159